MLKLEGKQKMYEDKDRLEIPGHEFCDLVVFPFTHETMYTIDTLS